MSLRDELAAISDDEWIQDEHGIYRCAGEDADGVPSWEVCDMGGYGYVVMEIGWYRQQGDWCGSQELVRLAGAMRAANKALTAYMQEALS